MYLGILHYIFFMYVRMFQDANEEEIERLLNESEFDFSGDDEYLPPEVLQNPHQLDESDEEEEEQPSEQHAEEVVQSSSRLFWRTKEMSCRGPGTAHL